MDSEYTVIPDKPNLALYFGQKVLKVAKRKKGQPHEWKIVFENRVVLYNYSPDETEIPYHLEGLQFCSMSMSVHDTTLHFRDPKTLRIIKWGLKPTSYTIHDPRHGGEVLPQWPEELEERGIAPKDVGKVSDAPPDTWSADYEQSIAEGDVRRQHEAEEFLEDTKNAD